MEGSKNKSIRELSKRLEKVWKDIEMFEGCIERDRERACRVSSPVLDGMPRAPGFRSRAEDAVIRIEESQEKLLDLQIEAVRLQKEIYQIIDQLPDSRSRLFAAMRYIDMEMWKDIPEIIGYSYTVAAVKKCVLRDLKKIGAF